MERLRIALLQLLPAGTLAGNLQKGLEYCRKAKEAGADIALFPEMWSTGYTLSQTPEGLAAQAITAESAFVRAFGEAAKALELAVGVTFLERKGAAFHNSVCLYDRFGRRVLSYAKVHTCDFGDERVLTPGDGFPVAALDTAQGTVQVGAMICYDREFPESARILMLRGAEVILTPNACPMEINRLSQLRARAYENMLAIATVNYPWGQPDCNGHSSVFDGIAYRPDDSGSRDTLVLEAGEREGLYLADVPVGALRDYRRREVHGNAYRRPEQYEMLISKEIRPPFLREDRRDWRG